MCDCNLAHALMPILQAMKKIPDATASGQRVGKAREITGMASDEGLERKRGHRNGTNRGNDHSFCDDDGLVPPQELGVGAAVPKIQMSCDTLT